MAEPLAPEGRRYRVISALGRGGFGTVFHAEMLGSGGFTKHVALKVLNPEVEGVEEIASRLRDEGRILGRLRHRAIVRVDGLVNFDGRWAVVMEYIEGADLRALLEEGPIPLGPALEILSEVSSALDAAYNKATADGKPIDSLNELEIVDGELYANVWGTDVIARIDPISGKVTGWIDLSNLLPAAQRGTSSVDAVLNGIAYDHQHRKLYVTGKFWPKLFEIELVRFQGR